MADKKYLIPVRETITTAWHKVSGTKGSVWAGIGIIVLVGIGFAILEAITKAVPFINGLITIINQIVVFLLQMGLLYIGIKRAAEMPITYKLMYRTYELSMTIRVILVYILKILILLPSMILLIISVVLNGLTTAGSIQPSGLMTTLIVILFIIGFISLIYLSIRIALGMAFALDQEVNPWQAIKMSFAATNENVWRLIGIYIIQLIIVIISMIPLGIGLIWTIPFILILYGTIYQRLLINTKQ